MFNQFVRHSAEVKVGRRAGVDKVVLGAAFLLVSLMMAYITLQGGMVSGGLMVVGILILPIVYTIIAYPRIGLLTLIALGYLVLFVMRFNVGFPLGTLIDALEVLLMFSFFLRQKYRQDWLFMKYPASILVLMWVGYNLLEVANPWADSRLAWMYTVRPIALVALTYFLFHFFVTDVKFIRTIFKLWIAMSVVVALYGLKQEYIGFAKFEMDWLLSDPTVRDIYFVADRWRTFSTLSDPMVFAYNMVAASILCIALMTGPLPTWKRVMLGGLVFLFFWSTLFSGTRGAFVLYPVALFFYGVLRFNKKLFLTAVVIAGMAGVLIMMPTSNYTLYRFQSAFKPHTDASFILRKQNQQKIQPFIQSHPLGGGLGATGIWGKRFSPYSQLASFPPDSGYVRVAVEAGWIGLFIFCTLIFVVLRTGVINYFTIRDPELKSYCLAMLLILFSLSIGNYPQDALVQYPINVYFYLAIAMLNITLKLDKEKQAEVEAKPNTIS
jgi:putative inorganic carbon (HCO3(-)) transporter